MNAQENKLLQYSTLSIVFLSLHKNANAQAAYIDIEPDFILDEQYEMEGIDMDSDGLNDFYFFNSVFVTYDYALGNKSHENLWVGAFDTLGNGIAGVSDYYLTATGTVYQYFPFALGKYFEIGPDLFFLNRNYQSLAFKINFMSLSLSINGGYWYPEVLDHYLGIKFKDESNKLHYGWIRCTVTDNGRTLIVKDYAYESKHDIPIMAGDTIGSHEIALPISEAENNNPSIYSFHKNIIINFSSPLHRETEIIIYDVLGNIVYKNKITELLTEITLDKINTGVYLVEIVNEEGKLSKKVFIE